MNETEGNGNNKWSDSENILIIELIEYADGLDVGYEKEESRMTPRFLAWRTVNEAAIYQDE